MREGAHAAAVYEAVDRWIEVALRSDDSLFTPGTPIWSAAVVADLYERFVEHPDEGKRPFDEKLRDQLRGAPAETIQLAGELLYVHFLPAVDMKGEHERSVIDKVLGWSPQPVSIPPELAGALDQGFASTGVAFKTYRPFQLFFLLEFIKKWKTLDSPAQALLLADPWEFKEFCFSLPAKAAQTQRAALLHLVHPETFESITSEGMKQRIASALSGYVKTESSDVDRQLADVRAALTEEYGHPIVFWDPEVKARWSPTPDPEPSPGSGPGPGPGKLVLSRQDIGAAREVFEETIPASSQARCAELLADLIELADETRPGCWTVNLFRRHVVLIVGNAYVASFRPDGAFFTLDTRDLDEQELAEIEAIATRAWEAGEWRSAPTFRSFQFSFASLETALPLVEPALRAAAVDLANRFRSSPFTEAYSSGLVRYLSEITGRTLPELDLGPSAGRRVAWVFQANPDIYAIDRALDDLPAIEWTVRQHRADVHEGDRVYIWRSGSQAGVLAIGTVIGEPTEREPAESERAYYLRPEAFEGSEPRVDVHIDHVLDQVLGRRVLADHPVIGGMNVIRMQGRGTNFGVTEEQDAALQEMIGMADAEPVVQPQEERYFVLQQRTDPVYGLDEEGGTYHFTPSSSGAWKRLAESASARFVYYRPKSGGGDTAQTFFGTGRIRSVEVEEQDGDRQFLAKIQAYAPFARPVPAQEFDPRSNVQMSIAEISETQLEELVRRGAQIELEPFTVGSIVRAAQGSPHLLSLDDDIYASVFAALESGKHIILTGPPGTAKTTLAQAVAEAAARAGLCSGHVLTTATADWTTYETIGGLRPETSGELVFEGGHFLDAIERNKWLVIDELNRSNFDRAFGQLFTVLSGQAVQLPYSRPGHSDRVVLAPEGAAASGSDVIRIPSSWRIVATMNVFDKSLLFEMSFALMRRFAFIEVASPDLGVFEDLVHRAAGEDAAAVALTMRLVELREFKDLGPALFMDMARFLAVRNATDGADEGQLAFEAFYSFLLPQFEGVDQATGERLYRKLRPMIGPGRSDRLCRTLNAVLGLDISDRRVVAEDDELPDDADADQE